MDEQSSLLTGAAPVVVPAVTKYRPVVHLLSVVAAVAALAGVATYGSGAGHSAKASSSLYTTFNDDDLEYELGKRIKAQNEYTAINGYAGKGYSHLSEGAVVEPHRLTTLVFSVPDGFEVDTSVGPFWNVTYNPTGKKTDTISNVIVEADGGNVELQATIRFTDIGSHHVSVHIPLVGAVKAYTASRGMYSHYVRRNIKKLTDTERGDFFDAYLTMYRLNTSIGHLKYGANFKGLKDYVGAHLSAAGKRNADKFHDGMGFLTQHAALTNEFETSLQSITPYISVPFWDYTEDGELVHKHKNLDVAWEQELWSADWFGNATSPEHFVEEGRFAYQKVFTSHEADVVKNPYGIMRAPWNVGKSLHLTRVHKFCQTSLGYDSWPYCPDHYNLTFGAEYGSFYEYIWTAGYVPHGPIHYYIGGYTNCENEESMLKTFQKLNLGQQHVDYFSQWMIFLPKNLWRSYMTESPRYCSMDANQTECHMQCLLDYNNKQDVEDFWKTVYDNVKDLGMSRVDNSADWLMSLEEWQSRGLMKYYCETPFTPGEQIEAASPLDISFWPIHPTMERLFQYKRLVNDFSNTEWANPNDDYTEYCTQGGNEKDMEEYMGRTPDDDMGTLCDGHHADDMTMFKSVVKEASGEYKKLATSNIELLRMINPSDYQVSYIYEDFTWEHCSGYYTFENVSWGDYNKQ